MRLDLHVHSTASDGAYPPAEVVRKAVDARIDVLALSDHDTTSGVGPAIEAASGQPIQIIPAIEMSSTRDGRELHILGYFVDVTSEALIAQQARAGGRRAERIREMIARLADLGVLVPEEEVFRLADEASVGRPHLARVMMAQGIVGSLEEAFDRWIGDSHEAFVPTAIHDPVEAIDEVRKAGGLAVWAHPPRDLVDTLTPELCEGGLDGLEVYRPGHSPSYTLTLEQLTARHGLVRTGGSDWHGPQHPDLGTFVVEDREVAEFLEKGGL